jgi:small ligand-binding sensory domain FIST
MHWSSASAEHADLDVAFAQCVDALRGDLQDKSVDLLFLFLSPRFAPSYERVPTLVESSFPGTLLLGNAAGGVIGGGHEREQRAALSLIGAHLPAVSLQPFRLDAADLPDADASPRAWHAALGVPPQPSPHFVLLADPFTFPAEKLLEGLDFAYPRSVKVGGLASGAVRPGGNVLYLERQVVRSGGVGVALAGEIAVETVVAQGCRPIGPVMQITRCEEHVLQELDDKPALQALQELAETVDSRDRALMAQALFLGIAMDELATEHGAGDFLIRNIVGIDPRQGALAVGERLRNGRSVQFHLRDAQAAAEDLEAVLQRFALGPHGTSAAGALLFSCVGRGEHLYGFPDHDSEVFRRVMGDLPLGGFFCNGEIGPVGGSTYLHGFTSSFGIFRAPSASGVQGG